MRRTLERKTQSLCIINELLLCGSGGTGRRARLRILWPKGRGGSNPSFRTKTSLKAKYSPIVSTSAAKQFPVLYNLPFCTGWKYPSAPVDQHVKRPLKDRKSTRLNSSHSSISY